MKMKNTFAAVLLLLTFSVLAQTPERWDLPLDPRDWKLVAEKREGRLTERVYVAPGESEYFWNEKIVVGHQRLAFSTDDYMTGFLEYVDGNCRPYKMKPLEQSEAEVFVQWDGDCRITGPQFEYRRVLVAKDGVHVFAFAAKTNRLSEAKRQAWLEILRSARLK
ncbi:MAG: hypothetical protein HKUEN07_18230 [Rhodocyclaceae bacterium]|jgi:hypothetical protein|uniref:Uncharacterized protein n=1 Tax=Candidatus Desulfobacillus denitrificans TaxID=2608985 RepID=A0A809R1U7_9PROT|nr:conserved hypothetical protein [Candidatus Desulfobacillus denitrificans]GIK44287.1 MAG: hypothetical protein BroJett012_01900 [Betaproteobacteria bacterium]GJQ55254.1 MAG: hypothetical protein HKUEN07_18230 [Rhodocyclaceae bacterium]